MAGFDAHKNLAISSVLTAPTPASSGTTLVLKAGEGARFGAPPFNATVWPSSAVPTPLNAEVVRVTAVSTDTLTLARAQEGSSARLIGVGDLIAATITAKTLTDLETRAALKDEANTFIRTQTLEMAGAQIIWRDTAATAGVRVFDIVNYGQTLQIRALTDDAQAITKQALNIGRDGTLVAAGSVYEQGRSTQMGFPIAVPYAAVNFYTYPAGTWAVSAANVTLNQYTMIGKTVIWTVMISNSTITAGVSHLAINNPVPGYGAAVKATALARVGQLVAAVYCQAGDPSVYVMRIDAGGASYPAGALGDVWFTLTMTLP